MKNKLLMLILWLCLMVYPIYGHTSYTIYLNGIVYRPQHVLFKQNDTLYISAKDLASITYGELNMSEPNHYELSIQNHILSFSPQEPIAKINQTVTILSPNRPLILQEEVYLPITILDTFNYPYNLDLSNQTLSFNTLAPYARTSDDYKDHVFTNTGVQDLTLRLQKILSSDQVDTLLTDAKRENAYISFIDNTDSSALLNLMRLDALTRKPFQVVFREMNPLSNPVQLGSLKTFPLEIKIGNKDIAVKIGDTPLSYNCIWTTYNPSDRDLKIDVSKSLDATLMRMLYENYRDYYDLKDDIHFSPVISIKRGRVDALTFTAYSTNSLGVHTTLDITIYQMLGEKTITYMIDTSLHQ